MMMGNASVRIVQGSSRDRVLAAIASGISRPVQISTTTGVPQRTVEFAIRSLAEDGVIAQPRPRGPWHMADHGPAVVRVQEVNRPRTPKHRPRVVSVPGSVGPPVHSSELADVPAPVPDPEYRQLPVEGGLEEKDARLVLGAIASGVRQPVPISNATGVPVRTVNCIIKSLAEEGVVAQSRPRQPWYLTGQGSVLRMEDVHPRAAGVYMVAFDNGTVKIGKSLNLAKRMAQHRSAGARFGVSVSESSSWAVEDVELAERLLIRWCRRVGSRFFGREYFQVDRELVRAFADTLWGG